MIEFTDGPASSFSSVDRTGDGIVNIFDINVVSSHWGESGPAGDANGDGIVNIFDINLISSNWDAGGGVLVQRLLCEQMSGDWHGSNSLVR